MVRSSRVVRGMDPELEPTPPPITPDPADEARRAGERERKQRWRLKKSRDAGKTEAPKRPGPVHAPAEIVSRLGAAGRVTDPVSPGEARRAFYRSTVGLARIIGSQADWSEDEFAELGESWADLARVFWPLRLVIRVLAPLVFIGCVVVILRKLVVTTPWAERRRQERELRKQLERVEAVARPALLEARREPEQDVWQVAQGTPPAGAQVVNGRVVKGPKVSRGTLDGTRRGPRR